MRFRRMILGPTASNSHPQQVVHHPQVDINTGTGARARIRWGGYRITPRMQTWEGEARRRRRQCPSRRYRCKRWDAEGLGWRPIRPFCWSLVPGGSSMSSGVGAALRRASKVNRVASGSLRASWRSSRRRCRSTHRRAIRLRPRC